MFFTWYVYGEKARNDKTPRKAGKQGCYDTGKKITEY